MHIGVIMIGYGDRVSIRNPSTGRRIAIESDEWREEYGRRVDRLIKALKRQGIALYWIGLPILRRSDANDDAQMMNDIVREKAYLNGIKFIDIQAQFADEAGNYAAYGPDLTGKSRLLRETDGILFTPAGYRKLAHFVEQEIKRDLTQARNERAIPLAGTEAEQKRIVNQRPRTSTDGDGGWKGTVNAVKEAKAGGQPKSAGTGQPVQTAARPGAEGRERPHHLAQHRRQRPRGIGHYRYPAPRHSVGGDRSDDAQGIERPRLPDRRRGGRGRRRRPRRPQLDHALGLRPRRRGPPHRAEPDAVLPGAGEGRARRVPSPAAPMISPGRASMPISASRP